jgi:hypothetical protein
LRCRRIAWRVADLSEVKACQSKLQSCLKSPVPGLPPHW